MATAHVDTFARDNLPPRSLWPELDVAALGYPELLNCAVELLDANVTAGRADAPALRFQGQVTTYAQLQERANRIAHVLVDELGIMPGNRILLRGPNNPTLVACWFATLKVGAIAVTTMPLLRSRELRYILDKAHVALALCDARGLDDLRAAGGPTRIVPYDAPDDPEALEHLAAGRSNVFDAVDTRADDVALIAFTSGTTGKGKGCCAFHRDVLAICDTFSRHILQPTQEDIFCGTPPLAFTYALGGLLLFPFRVGACAVMIEQPSPQALLDAVERDRASIMFTAPTMYRNLLPLVGERDITSLRICVSAGEPLPASTSNNWHAATGLRIIDGIGATEMLHIFISAAGDAIRPGSTGRAVPGYEARVVSDDGAELPAGEVGKLAVKGPTGCRYLADPVRQRDYVRNGWNITGDAYLMDDDGYFWFQARADDMILSSGYNIAGPEVESVLLEHPAVRECAVVGAPDAARGNLVTAYVVLREPSRAGDDLVAELQAFVRQEIAPYKYPRRVEFVGALPRTETGKLQRFKLREMASESVADAK